MFVISARKTRQGGRRGASLWSAPFVSALVKLMITVTRPMEMTEISRDRMNDKI